MSWQALGWAWQQQVGDPEAKLLLVALADKSNELGECFPGQAQLQLDCEVSDRTLRRRMDVLVAGGYLRVERRRLDDGRLSGNRYYLQLGHRPLVAEGETNHRPQLGPVAHRPLVAGQEPSEVLEPSQAPSVASLPSVRAPRVNLLWDVFDQLLGPTTNKGEGKRRGVALTLIRESLGVASEAGVTPAHAAELHARVCRAQRLWEPRITVTEMGIAHNWRTLGSDQSAGSVTVEQLLQQADEEEAV